MKIFDLNKQYILDRIEQVSIFEKFLNIKVQLDIKIKSPFRGNDKDASCSFKYNDRGTLRLKDFGKQSINCDCFELVGLLYGIDCNNRQGFMLILNIIAKEFNLIHGSTIEKKLERLEEVATKKKIIPVITDMDYIDYKYWAKGNVNAAKLKSSSVRKCKFIFIDDELIYIESTSNPAYLYLFTKKDLRIYFPLSKKNKFITSSNCVQGIHLLKGIQNFVIINKSFKDVLSITSFFVQGNEIESFALGSENSLLSKEGYKYLTETLGYKYIFTLTDYDPTGLHCAWIHRKTYGTIPLYIKNKTWNSGIKYAIKDFWDLAVYLGKEETQKVIDKQYEKLNKIYGRE